MRTKSTKAMVVRLRAADVVKGFQPKIRFCHGRRWIKAQVSAPSHRRGFVEVYDLSDPDLRTIWTVRFSACEVL